jgi:fructose-1,6-bisphosphatase II
VVPAPLVWDDQRGGFFCQHPAGPRFDERGKFHDNRGMASLTTTDPERTIEFEFVRATENAALNSLPWLGRGEKEKADAAACDAIFGVFDLVDICGEVVIGEGIKDNAPGIFLGEHLGTWRMGSPRFEIALDPIDGTTNIAQGLPNSISVMAASEATAEVPHVMKNLPTFYSTKLAYGPEVVQAIERGMDPISLDAPVEVTLNTVAKALGKRVQELVVMTLQRPRHAEFIAAVRRAGAALRLVTDGDITAAVAPSLPDSGVDLYYGIGGSPEGILTAAALRALGGEMLLRMWPRDEAERASVLKEVGESELTRVYRASDLIWGDSCLFCATGISDSSLLPGVTLKGKKAITHSILMRAKSRTVRYIKAVHDLECKTIHIRSERADRKLI